VEFVVISIKVRYANDAHLLNRSSISTIGTGDSRLPNLRFLLICKEIWG
jgi:hypothetical protein